MLTGDIRNEIPSWYPEALQEILTIFKKTDFKNIETGRHEVRGDDIFFMVLDASTQKAETAKPEDHEVYIDVQFISEGEEIFGAKLGNEGLIEADAYNPERDIRFYEPTTAYDKIHFKKDMYIVVWPEDIHIPGLDMPDGPRQVLKVVGKIKKDLL